MTSRILKLVPGVVLVLFMLNGVLSCDDCYIKSRATFYGSVDYLGTPGGACGYKSFGRNLNGGDVAAVAFLYRDGAGCGACYQIRCTDPNLCNSEGINVVVTDFGHGDRTDFILSPSAYSKLAINGKSIELVASGVVEIEFRRISCRYPGYNIMFKVDENSKYPDYLALNIWYQGGRKDIVAVEVSLEGSNQWKPCRRSHGAVWDIVSPPRGALSVRFLVTDEHQYKEPLPISSPEYRWRMKRERDRSEPWERSMQMGAKKNCIHHAIVYLHHSPCHRCIKFQIQIHSSSKALPPVHIHRLSQADSLLEYYRSATRSCAPMKSLAGSGWFFDAAAGRMTHLFCGSDDEEQEEGMTDVFLHDVNTRVEKMYANEFLCKRNLVGSSGRLWHFMIAPLNALGKKISNGFCDP
eukprot:Gb_19114 [translate_table: standard]